MKEICYNFSHPDEDDRLLILIIVSSFIILSLILIIGITSCILICFEDSLSDRKELPAFSENNKVRPTFMAV